MKGKIYKLKKGKEKVWLKWLKVLEREYNKEVKDTLKEENATFELWLVFKQGQHYYAVGANDAKLPANKEHFLNKMHFEKKSECFDYAVGTF